MRVLYALPLIITSTLAAPAVIWKQAASKLKETIHTNEYTDATDLINDVVKSCHSASDKLSSVIFLIGRDVNGNEALSYLGQNDKLPETKKKYEESSPESVYYNVANLESQHTVLRDASKAVKDVKGSALSVSLDELESKLKDVEQDLEEVTSKSKRKRMKAIENASVLIVNVDMDQDMSSLDSAISSSIDKAQSTILAGIRSSEEVKAARKLSKMTSSRRRLEDQGDDDANNNDYSGVYYVNMTPNIFAGLLFTFFFLFVTYLGIACMSMIQGQDVYVDKMPSIGREA